MRHATITREPIEVAQLLASVAAPGHGATVLFIGTVRDMNAGRAVLGLEYSAYEAMAREELAAICVEAEGRFTGCRVAVAHRLGQLTLGETSVVVAGAHAHRDSAFEACRYVIEALKRRVPIWKREQYSDGRREWVPAGGAGDEPVCS